MTRTVKRQSSIRVSVSEEMKTRIDNLATVVGVPTATLASLAIGLYVAQQERNFSIQEQMIQTMATQVGGQLGEHIQAMWQAEKEQQEQQQ